ncbi:MAG: PA2169 family four-helix-bundle protein [Pyrinomonadaceae bacterium]|nr:PA2169 family four-helix-bundle protein [Pyrinomonadaceae bacterium]
MINDYEATKAITTDGVPVSTETETASNADVIAILNGLIETCKDGQNGFKTAAEGIERSELKTVFYEFSQQRSEFSGILQGLVRELGGDPESTGTLSAAVHRGWIDIKSLVTGKDEEAILNECERGEDFAKEAYADALKTSLPANIADVIEQQAHAVLVAHNRIKSLRNAESHETATPGIF